MNGRLGDLIMRLLGCWILLTVTILLVLGLTSLARGQQPVISDCKVIGPKLSHCKVTNPRVAPPKKVLIPFIRRSKDCVCIVAYRLYKVEMVEHLPPDMLGWTEESARSLKILTGQDLEDEQIAVEHEIMHAAIGTDRSDEKQSLHEAIYLFSSMRPALMKSNPELVKYLTQ